MYSHPLPPVRSKTRDIYVVASEWDTQIGKQLRGMADNDILSSYIFSTNVGVRAAEPCSISVAATHQLLTQIFELICVNVLSHHSFRNVSGARITETDLKILSRLNSDCIRALECVTGIDREGKKLKGANVSTNVRLRVAGKLWSDHILENARAHIFTFLYVFFTVTFGYPLVTGVAIAAGLDVTGWLYLSEFINESSYFELFCKTCFSCTSVCIYSF